MLLAKFPSIDFENKRILHNVSFGLKAGQTCFITGTNGSGKSTLLNVLAGNGLYSTADAELSLNGSDIATMPAHERARAGLFFIAQYSPVIPGLSVFRFLKELYGALRGPVTDIEGFATHCTRIFASVGLPEQFLEREVGVGFSGGERKRFELAQLLLVEPTVLLLDEIDSGLDRAALITLGDMLAGYKQRFPDTIMIIVTHYDHLAQYVRPDVILHVVNNTVQQQDASHV